MGIYAPIELLRSGYKLQYSLSEKLCQRENAYTKRKERQTNGLPLL